MKHTGFVDISMMSFQEEKINKNPTLLKMWNDPKFKSFMLKNDFFNDWGPSYLKDYGWYFECPKDSTPTKEHAL